MLKLYASFLFLSLFLLLLLFPLLKLHNNVPKIVGYIGAGFFFFFLRIFVLFLPSMFAKYCQNIVNHINSFLNHVKSPKGPVKGLLIPVSLFWHIAFSFDFISVVLLLLILHKCSLVLCKLSLQFTLFSCFLKYWETGLSHWPTYPVLSSFVLR